MDAAPSGWTTYLPASVTSALSAASAVVNDKVSQGAAAAQQKWAPVAERVSSLPTAAYSAYESTSASLSSSAAAAVAKAVDNATTAAESAKASALGAYGVAAGTVARTASDAQTFAATTTATATATAASVSQAAQVAVTLTSDQQAAVAAAHQAVSAWSTAALDHANRTPSPAMTAALAAGGYVVNPATGLWALADGGTIMRGGIKRPFWIGTEEAYLHVTVGEPAAEDEKKGAGKKHAKPHGGGHKHHHQGTHGSDDAGGGGGGVPAQAVILFVYPRLGLSWPITIEGSVRQAVPGVTFPVHGLTLGLFICASVHTFPASPDPVPIVPPAPTVAASAATAAEPPPAEALVTSSDGAAPVATGGAGAVPAGDRTDGEKPSAAALLSSALGTVKAAAATTAAAAATTAASIATTASSLTQMGTKRGPADTVAIRIGVCLGTHLMFGLVERYYPDPPVLLFEYCSGVSDVTARLRDTFGMVAPATTPQVGAAAAAVAAAGSAGAVMTGATGAPQGSAADGPADGTTAAAAAGAPVPSLATTPFDGSSRRVLGIGPRPAAATPAGTAAVADSAPAAPPARTLTADSLQRASTTDLAASVIDDGSIDLHLDLDGDEDPGAPASA